MRLTGDINMLRDMLADALLLGVSEGLVLISMLVVMTVMNWRLHLVALVILPLVALTTLRSRCEFAKRRAISASAKEESPRWSGRCCVVSI